MIIRNYQETHQHERLPRKWTRARLCTPKGTTSTFYLPGERRYTLTSKPANQVSANVSCQYHVCYAIILPLTFLHGCKDFPTTHLIVAWLGCHTVFTSNSLVT